MARRPGHQWRTYTNRHDAGRHPPSLHYIEAGEGKGKEDEEGGGYDDYDYDYDYDYD